MARSSHAHLGDINMLTARPRLFSVVAFLVFVLVPPDLEPGKTYAYKIEASIVTNNYTTIVRTREITFKAGEEVTLDLRKEDPKVKDNVLIRWVPTPRIVAKDMGELAKITKDD